jgi:hypothetical protein
VIPTDAVGTAVRRVIDAGRNVERLRKELAEAERQHSLAIAKLDRAWKQAMRKEQVVAGC